MTKPGTTFIKLLVATVLLFAYSPSYCWGFYAHRKINYQAVFLLPPSLLSFYKPHIDFISEHAVDTDKRRYAVAEEGARHYIDLDRYGSYPFDALPRRWDEAVACYSEDTLQQRGIVPWWIQLMLHRLTEAFREKNKARILKFSAEIGHYLADAHVPLHVSSNHNGQHTGQHGIHGFWESRLPELLAEREWNFFMGKAEHLANPGVFIWQRVLESARAADTVLQFERELSVSFPQDQKFSFEPRNGIIIRQYSTAYSRAYDQKLGGMVERRMRQSIHAVASFWYTAWVNAGQPDLSGLDDTPPGKEEQKEYEELDRAWRRGSIKGREHE